jgi:hypothetical protein
MVLPKEDMLKAESNDAPIVLRSSDRFLLVTALNALRDARPGLAPKVDAVLKAMGSGGPRHVEKYIGGVSRGLVQTERRKS